jgi:hypothetical protein
VVGIYELMMRRTEHPFCDLQLDLHALGDSTGSTYILFTIFREAWSLRQAILLQEKLLSVRVGSEISATGRGCKLENPLQGLNLFTTERGKGS